MLAFGRTLIYVVEIEIEIDNVTKEATTNSMMCSTWTAMQVGVTRKTVINYYLLINWYMNMINM